MFQYPLFLIKKVYSVKDTFEKALKKGKLMFDFLSIDLIIQVRFLEVFFLKIN